MRYVAALILCLLGVSLQAQSLSEWTAASADIVVIGEIHDNTAHHALQARFLRDFPATAVIYEMLTPDEARRLDGVARDAGAMRAAVFEFHWSNIADYADVLAASQGAIIGAALPRDQVRQAFSEGAAAVFGVQSKQYGLERAVPGAQLELRKRLQYEAHCDAMPIDMMGGMVEAQRLRDAAFARTVLDALNTHGAPVVLITGNGHARKDWGVPFFVGQVAPLVRVLSIGQSELQRPPEGGFDVVFDAAPVTRPDPCAAFR